MRHSRHLSRPGRVAAGSLLIVAVLFLTSWSGSSMGASNATAPRGGTLTYGSTSVNQTANHAKIPQNMFTPLAYDPLLRTLPNGKVGPGLATSGSYVGKGNKVFRLTLRRGLVFSDGTPFDADAVKTWFEYMAKAGGPDVATMGKMVSITTPNRWTVQFTLDQSNPFVPTLLSHNWGSVASPAVVKSNPDSLATSTAGVGRYVLVPNETVLSDHYTFVPNPRYHDKSRIYWKKIVVRAIPDPSTMMNALQTGQIQGASAPFSTYPTAKKLGLQIFFARAFQQGFVIADRNGVNAKALADWRVRQALNYAIDRKTICNALYPGYGRPTSLVANRDVFDKALVNAYPYRPAKAKALLAAAGYGDGFSLSLISEDFVGAEYINGSQAVAAAWEKLGIKVNVIHATDISSYFNEIRKAPSIIQSPTVFAYSMAQTYNVNLSQDAVKNPHHVVESALDKMVKEGLAQDPAEAAKTWNAVAKFIVQQASFVQLCEQPTTLYVKKGIGNVVYNTFINFPLLADWTPPSK